jgi:putative ABC transport system substrate-binding protein
LAVRRLRGRLLRAQQPAMPVIGLLGSESLDLWASRMRAFHQGLSETGYVDGRNVAIEYRWAEGHNDRLPALAADLVRRRVTVIAAPGSTPATLAAKAATSTIPIIFWIGADPIELGLVASLNRPEGNLTDVTTLNHGLVAKRVELLHEVVPGTSSITVLINPTSPTLTKTSIEDAQAAARSLGLELHVLNASTERDFDVVFANLIQLGAGGLVIGTDTFFSSRLEQLAALSVRYAVPTVYHFREFAAAGGLIAYGGSLADAFRGTGVYTGHILKGEKPADLPVQQVTKVELYINLKTARALGLDIPLPLIGRANEVIE